LCDSILEERQCCFRFSLNLFIGSIEFISRPVGIGLYADVRELVGTHSSAHQPILLLARPFVY
jgi:hypothetical protein